MRRLILLLLFWAVPATALPNINYAGMFFQTVNANYVRRTGALTAARLPYIGTNGVLVDSANAKLDSNGYLQAVRYYFSTAGTSGSFITQTAGGSFTIQASVTGGDGDIVISPAAGRGAYYNYSNGDWVAFGNGASGVRTSIYQGERWSIGSSGLTGSTGQFDVNITSSSREGIIVKGASGQSARLFEARNNSDTVLSGIDASGRFYAPTALVQTTVGGAGGGSALPATPSGYLKVNINGTERIIPYYPAS